MLIVLFSYLFGYYKKHPNLKHILNYWRINSVHSLVLILITWCVISFSSLTVGYLWSYLINARILMLKFSKQSKSQLLLPSCSIIMILIDMDIKLNMTNAQFIYQLTDPITLYNYVSKLCNILIKRYSHCSFGECFPP